MIADDQNWYLHRNEITGGWAIMLEDRPPVEQGDKDEVATFVHKGDAEELVRLHNDRKTVER